MASLGLSLKFHSFTDLVKLCSANTRPVVSVELLYR